MKPTFTLPKIVRSEKGWYVYFRYCGKVKTYRKGVNYEKDTKSREKAFEELRKVLTARLKSGWNPLTEELDLYNSDMTLIQAVLFGLQKKKATLAVRTYESYQTGVNYFIDGVKALNMDYMPIKDTKRLHIKRILAKTQEIKNWSNKAYNKNFGYIRACINELEEWEIIEHSPARMIKKLPEVEEEANTPPTEKEAKLIREKILAEFPSFWKYVVTIFHTGIRNDELLSLKVGMVNLENLTMNLPPSITKTPRYRIVPINKHLEIVLLSLNLEQYPDDYYVFGSNREFTNRPLERHLDFVPGENKLSRETPTTLWKKLIKKGLSINTNLYAMKHFGANKKILAGLDLETLSELYGHKSKLMTMRYAKIVKEVYRKQIIEQSPDY